MILVVEKISLALMMLFTAKQIELNIFCNTLHHAVAMKYMEYTRTRGGFCVARNLASVMIGGIGATLVKYVLSSQ